MGPQSPGLSPSPPLHLTPVSAPLHHPLRGRLAFSLHSKKKKEKDLDQERGEGGDVSDPRAGLAGVGCLLVPFSPLPARARALGEGWSRRLVPAAQSPLFRGPCCSQAPDQPWCAPNWGLEASSAGSAGKGQRVPSFLLGCRAGEGLPVPSLEPASQADGSLLGPSGLERVQEAKPRSGPHPAWLAQKPS